METIIVLPLYLILLGGIFMVGDTMLGRFVLQVSGRYEAWATHTLVELPRTVSVFEFAEVEPAFHLGKDGESSPYSTGFLIDDGSRANGNRWAYARIGRTRGTVGVPFWAAMFDVQRETIDSNSNATKRENTIHDDGATFCWAFDYHRISEADIAQLGSPDVFRRSNPCLKLEDAAIAGDSHFCDEVRDPSPRGQDREPYQRNPLLMSLGN